MIISRKSIFSTIMALFLIASTIVYGLIYSTNKEDANIYSKEINIDKYVDEYLNILTINESNNQTCDSSLGLCGPPQNWYSTN